MFDATNVDGGPHLIERRSSPRSRSYLGGQLLELHRGLSTPCVVRNTSPVGARVDAPHPERMAADPLLVIMKQGIAYETATAWMGKTRIGLRLLVAHPLHGEVAVAHQRARELWLETLPRKT